MITKQEKEEIVGELWNAVFFLNIIVVILCMINQQWVLGVFAFLPLAVYGAKH